MYLSWQFSQYSQYFITFIKDSLFYRKINYKWIMFDNMYTTNSHFENGEFREPYFWVQ